MQSSSEVHYSGSGQPPPNVVELLSSTGLSAPSTASAIGSDLFGGLDFGFGSLELDETWRSLAPSRPRSAFSLLGDSFFNDSLTKFSTLRGGLLDPSGDPSRSWFRSSIQIPSTTPTPAPTPVLRPSPGPTPTPFSGPRPSPQPTPTPSRPAPSFGARGARGFSGTQQYEALKQQCRSTGALFEDWEVLYSFDYKRVYFEKRL